MQTNFFNATLVGAVNAVPVLTLNNSNNNSNRNNNDRLLRSERWHK